MVKAARETKRAPNQRAKSMTTTKAMRFASVITAVNVLVASGFAIAAIIRPQYLLPPGTEPNQASLIMALYAAARTLPLAAFALGAIVKRSGTGLLVLGGLAGAMQVLDAGIGLFNQDMGKFGGPLFLGVLQFLAVYTLYRSLRNAPQPARG